MTTDKNILVMGVSGSGKTTIGKLLAEKLNLEFVDADDFHSQKNKDKMRVGIPLSDEDRQPWLHTLRLQLVEKTPVVLACSALKQRYRDVLDPDHLYEWIYLEGSRTLLHERLSKRNGHYMKANLLESQLETLEEPENALRIDIAALPGEIITTIISHFASKEN